MAKNGQEPSLTSLMSDDLKRSVNLTGPLVHFLAIRPRPAPWSARVMAPLVGSASRRRCGSRGARRRVSRCVWF